ncbi:MAG TPA: Fe-S cluster assembly protein SufD [Candidatus Methylacidiphilales bacterium]
MIAPAPSSPPSLRISTIPGEPEWVSSRRKSELARFVEKGLPSVREEDWRFTNVKPVAGLAFEPAGRPADPGAEVLEAFPLAKLPGSRLVFINGHFFPALSSIGERGADAKIMTLAEALVREPELIKRHLFQSSQDRETSFGALNGGLFRDGAFIYVPKGVSLADPVHLLYLFTPGGSGEASYPRNLIVAEEGAQLTVVESYAGTIPGKYFTNGVTELAAGDGASIEYLKLQDESRESFHLGTIAVSVGRASRVRIHSMALGAKLSRTNIHAKLAGEGAECLLNGLYVVDEERLADHYMIVDHAMPHGTSHEYFNGILAGKSKGVFHGRIIVELDAQKTDAKQTNKNLLLSDDATIDTKPQLEIYADDVKCTHGATIGQLSDEAIFYLRSRGIPRETARRMLIHAFAGEIIDRVRHEAIREELNDLVLRRLEQNQSTEFSTHVR